MCREIFFAFRLIHFGIGGTVDDGVGTKIIQETGNCCRIDQVNIGPGNRDSRGSEKSMEGGAELSTCADDRYPFDRRSSTTLFT